MKKITDYLKSRKLLFLLCFLFFLIRLPYLDQMYLLHDERDIALSGYTIAKEGRDLYGNSFPLRFEGISPKNPVVAIYYSALWWLFLPERSVSFARLPYVFISSFFILLIYEFVNAITRDKKISIISACIFCFSPWIYHLSRLAMDINLAFVLLLVGMILYIKEKIVPSFVFFLLAAFTYLGFRVLIPILLFYLTVFLIIKKTSKTTISRSLLLNTAFIVVLFSSIFFVDRGITSERFQNEVLFSKSERIVENVHFKRMTSIAPEKVKALFHNRYTASFDILFDNILSGFELSYLFKKGDYSAVNGNTSSGQFFMPFAIFLVLGLMSAAQRRRREDFFIVGLIFVGMAPSLASVVGESYSIRAILSGIGYAYLLSLGVVYAYAFLKKLKPFWSGALIGLFTVLLLVNITFFIYNYFLRRPVTVAELFNEHERTLARHLIHENAKTTVFHTYPQEVYLTYVFLNNNIKSPDIKLVGEPTMQAGDVSFALCLRNRNFLTVNPKVVYDGCLTEEQYKDWVGNDRADRTLPYVDYSKKLSYFVFE